MKVRSRSRYHRFAQLVFVPLLLLGVFAAAAGAEPVTVRVPVVETFPSCTGEDVLLTGEQKITTNIRSNGAGGTWVDLSVENRGLSGVGVVTGAKYVGLDTTEDHVNLPPGNASNATFVHNLNLIRQGEAAAITGGDDLHLKELFHFTMNATGTPSLTTEFRSDCT